MIGLLQRVSQAHVVVDSSTIAAIDSGLLVLIGIEKSDTPASADHLLRRLLGYRVFSDNEDKMNLSLQQTGGGLLLVPQFTLAANTDKGTRASFSSAAPPDLGEQLFTYLVQQACALHQPVASGQFGANMQVSLTNDGPVTFWLQV